MALRAKSAADWKWLLYVSQTKLDMLYQQIARSSTEKAGLDWGLNLKFLTVTRKHEQQITPDRDDMLKAVVEEIEASSRVGTVDQPNDFIKGTLPMRWGGIDDGGRPSQEAPLVYFGGFTEETVFGLGGSMRHVLGMAGMGNTSSRSGTPFLIRHLVQGLEFAPEGWRACSPAPVDEDDYQARQAIAYATYMLRKQALQCNLEFFAKTLFVGEVRHETITQGRNMRCLLGTPLYVALAFPYPEETMHNL